MGMEQQVLQLISTKSQFIPPSLAIMGLERNNKSSSSAWCFCELLCAKVGLLGCFVWVSEHNHLRAVGSGMGCGSRALEQLNALLRNQPVHPLTITET